MISNPVTKRRKITKVNSGSDCNKGEDEMMMQHPTRDQCVYVVSLAQYWGAVYDRDLPKVEVDCLGFFRHEGAAVRTLIKDIIRREQEQSDGSIIDLKKFAVYTNPELAEELTDNILDPCYDPIRRHIVETGEEVIMAYYMNLIKPNLESYSSSDSADIIIREIITTFLVEKNFGKHYGFLVPRIQVLPLEQYGIKLKRSNYIVVLGQMRRDGSLDITCVGIYAEEVDAVRGFLTELVINQSDDVDYYEVINDDEYVYDIEPEWDTYRFREQLMDKMLETYYSLAWTVAAMSRQEALNKYVATVYEKFCYRDPYDEDMPAEQPFMWNMAIFYRQINDVWDDADGIILM
jgi:uncharacterized protein YjfI (DUF2170 family)